MSIESGMMYQAPNTKITKSNHAPWPDNSCDNGISSAEKGYDVIVWQVNPPQHTEHSLLERPMCMLDMGGSESIKYFILVATIFSLVGLVYVMLFPINGEIPIVVNRT